MDYWLILRLVLTALVLTLGVAILYQVHASQNLRLPPPVGGEPG